MPNVTPGREGVGEGSPGRGEGKRVPLGGREGESSKTRSNYKWLSEGRKLLFHNIDYNLHFKRINTDTLMPFFDNYLKAFSRLLS